MIYSYYLSYVLEVLQLILLYRSKHERMEYASTVFFSSFRLEAGVLYDIFRRRKWSPHIEKDECTLLILLKTNFSVALSCKSLSLKKNIIGGAAIFPLKNKNHNLIKGVKLYIPLLINSLSSS